MLFNIFLASLVIIPMAYFLMSGRSKDNKLKSIFLSRISENGVQVSDVEVWQKGVVGLDTKNNILYYQGFNGTDDQLKSIDLTTVKSCILEKSYSNESVHNSATKVLHKAILVIKGTSNSTEIKMYDAEETIQMQDDVLNAIKWEKIINAVVLNLKN